MPDTYFDLHPFEMRHEPRWKGFREKLAKNAVPIWMCEKYPQVPASVKYPKERILAEFQPKGRNVFTNQAAWMIALLLTQGVTKIGLFGINYGIEDEREKQRDSLVYWLGRAEDRGVEIVLPPESTILREPMELYGYESHDENGWLLPCYQGRKTRSIQNAKNEDVELTILKPGEDNPRPVDLPIFGTEQATSRRPGL